MARKAKAAEESKQETPESVAHKIADLIINNIGPKYKTIGTLTEDEKKLADLFQASIAAAAKAMEQLQNELNAGIQKQHKALWSAICKGHKLSPKKHLHLDHKTGEIQEHI